MDVASNFQIDDVDSARIRRQSELMAIRELGIAPQQTFHPIVIIDSCPLYRDCLMRALVAAIPNPLIAYSGSQAYLAAPHRNAALVVLCTSGTSLEQAERDLDALLANHAPDATIVVIGDDESGAHIRKLMAKGIRGFIPTSLPLVAAIEAINLIKAGCTFAPAASLLHALTLRASPEQGSTPAQGATHFTTKQLSVIEAIRRGKANKVIAYELNMCESTVKVHVRTIMKKLRAKNRTQVALLTQHLAGSSARPVEHALA